MREEEKFLPTQENQTVLSLKGLSRIRGGAVTQGFKTNDRRRIDIRNSVREPTEGQENDHQENEYIQDKYPVNNTNYPQHPMPQVHQNLGRYDNMYQQPSIPYSN